MDRLKATLCILAKRDGWNLLCDTSLDIFLSSLILILAREPSFSE
jgi:hypothetical protein